MSFGPPPSSYTQSTLVADSTQRNRRRRKLLGVVFVVVVAVLCAGGGFLWFGGDDPAGGDNKSTSATVPQGRLDVRQTVEKRPANTSGSMAFRFSADDMGPGEEYTTPGTWATDKILAKGINRTLVGFKIGKDAAAGDETWSIRLAGPICGVTRHVTVQGRTAVLHRSGEDEESPCDHVSFVDLNTGDKLWDKSFPTSDTVFGQDPTSVTLTHGTVAVTWGDGSAAYDMDKGSRLWKKSRVSDCKHMGLAGDRGLLMLLSCVHPKDTTYQVRKLDPRTGDAKWTYQVADGVKGVNLLSAEPAVIAPAAGDVEVTHLISLNDRGKQRATVRLEGGHYVVNCEDPLDFGAVDNCPSTVVSGDQVFVTSREDPHGDMVNNANRIVSFDLKTGKTVLKFESGRNQLLYPLRMSGDQLLALRDSTDHITPSALVSLNPKTGKETPYFYYSLPIEGWTLTAPDSNDIVVQNGRLFFGAPRAMGPTGGKKKEWVWLTIGIESAKQGRAS
ncbi:PQQ-binding-like beta-propeller repeat protein [Streptomyces sp. NPDC048441]|uniref:outer membrane protein assembly factor BamB family protein n=1 Tax=Streptomyces sp. NPDC048441 TaxID=3365552 RepID=UPI003723DDBF